MLEKFDFAGMPPCPALRLDAPGDTLQVVARYLPSRNACPQDLCPCLRKFKHLMAKSVRYQFSPTRASKDCFRAYSEKHLDTEGCPVPLGGDEEADNQAVERAGPPTTLGC